MKKQEVKENNGSKSNIEHISALFDELKTGRKREKKKWKKIEDELTHHHLSHHAMHKNSIHTLIFQSGATHFQILRKSHPKIHFDMNEIERIGRTATHMNHFVHCPPLWWTEKLHMSIGIWSKLVYRLWMDLRINFIQLFTFFKYFKKLKKKRCRTNHSFCFCEVSNFKLYSFENFSQPFLDNF